MNCRRKKQMSYLKTNKKAILSYRPIIVPVYKKFCSFEWKRYQNFGYWHFTNCLKCFFHTNLPLKHYMMKYSVEVSLFLGELSYMIMLSSLPDIYVSKRMFNEHQSAVHVKINNSSISPSTQKRENSIKSNWALFVFYCRKFKSIIVN